MYSFHLNASASANHDLQDASQAFALLQQAVDRLKRAVEFGRADPEPCVALGDALAAQAELMTSKGEGCKHLVVSLT
jgi:hypothetical protein